MKNIGRTQNVLFFLLAIIVMALTAAPAWAIEGLSRGHNIFLERGLQIQALSYITQNPSGLVFNPTRWAESNFTTIDIWDNGPYPVTLMQQIAPGIPWSTDGINRGGDLYPADIPYAPSLVQIKYGDEMDITDASYQLYLRDSMNSMHTKFPHVLTATNQYGEAHTAAELQNYMQVVQPDMLHFDTYPFNAESTLMLYYKSLAKYRNLGLAGNDGTGLQPIPVGIYTKTFINTYQNHILSESEIRLNNFSAWAFGCKMVEAFYYDRYIDESVPPLLFTVPGTSNPTPQFYQQAETNRQSLNLGPALVRLISTDVRMEMGQSESGASNPLPDGITAWDSTADSYLKTISAANLGTKNNGKHGDVIVGFLKALDASLTNPGHEDDVYFMIVNGLSDEVGTAADCRQSIHLDFDFGASGINQLLRMSRDTGGVETVTLDHNGGSLYSLDLILDGGTGDLFKYDNGGEFVSQPPVVHYTFKETAPGTWEVLVDVSGVDTAGLSAYEIWVDGVDPATVSFEENVLATVVGAGYDPVGFMSLLQGDVGGSFNAGNFQGSGDTAMEGIGMVEVYEEGSMPGTTPLVDLDVPALLGILSTEAGLTEENFRVMVVGLLNEMGDGFYDASGLIPTFEVIVFALLLGDANNDGVVSAADYASVQANFGNTGEAGILGDANGDGVVSAADYASVQANFGNVTGAQATPEPATLSLLVIGGVAMIHRRKRAS